MRKFPSVLILAFFLSGAEVLPRPAQQGPLVHVSGGSLRGYFQGTTAVFKGIPYAAPPVGDMRWREPQPPLPWAGVRDATKPGSACVQDPAGFDAFIKPLASVYGASYETERVTSSEDCLYLNVWAPLWPPREPLPVMVWLHGGSNAFGSGSQSMYDGTSLVAHGVILITINYRLGVLGFFSHPELTAESPHHSSGNYGLLDQLAVVRWVRENAARFGGDPENVTLFGESSGATDAGALMASPLCAHLFRRVITESGPPFGLAPIQTRAQAEAVGVSISKAAPGNSPSLANLRSLPAAQLLQLANAQPDRLDPSILIADGWVLTEPPGKAFASGAVQKVDLLAGMNAREWSAFRLAPATEAKALPKQEQSGPVARVVKSVEGLAETAHLLYGGWTYAAITLYLFRALIDRQRGSEQASDDMLMACPVGAMAGLTRAQGGKVFVYRFDRSIPGKGELTLGAFHTLELPYVFNALRDRSWRWLAFTALDDRLAGVMETYWTNFAKTGSPNSPGTPEWPAWESDDGSYMEFAPNGTPASQQHFAPAFCDLSLERLRNQILNAE